MVKINLIADAGASKTEWVAVDSNAQVAGRYETAGFNPNYHPISQLERMIALELMPQMGLKEVDSVMFYGSGCGTKANQLHVSGVLQKGFLTHLVEVESDMLGACRGLLQREAGLACILGTGSNSCLYDGNQIQSNLRSAGFILGDEGSGTYIGKLFLKSCLYNELPADLMKAFHNQFYMNQDDIINRLYKEPFPTAFLASVVPFVAEYQSDSFCQTIVAKAFDDFIVQQIMRYEYPKNGKIGFVGSVAYYFKNILLNQLQKHGYENVIVEKRATDGLLSYHAAGFKTK